MTLEEIRDKVANLQAQKEATIEEEELAIKEHQSAIRQIEQELNQRNQRIAECQARKDAITTIYEEWESALTLIERG